MASGFTPPNTPKRKCDECHSDVKSCQASYRLEIKKNLCNECAIKHQDSIKGLADKVKWTYQKHTDKTAELFCVSHNYPICQVCALTSYHTDCKRDDLYDVKTERVKQLVDLMRDAQDRCNDLKQSDVEVQKMTRHLNMIREQLSTAAQQETKRVTNDRDQKEEMINAEYDQKVKKLNEERNERLKCTRDEAEKILQKIRDEQYSLQEQLDRIERGLEACKTKLVPGLEEVATKVRDGCMKAENLIINQENLMKDFQDVTRQMMEHLHVELSTERLDIVKGEIEKLKFKKGSGSKILGTIEGLEEQWVKVRDVCQSSNRFLGCTSSYVVITEKKNVLVVYLDKMKHNGTRKIIGLGEFKPHCYNALSDGGHIVGTTDGKLMVYDQLWNYARTIDTKFQPSLLVTVNKDGLILVAKFRGSAISVFHPKDGKCLNTIKLADDMLINELKTMSTGDMIVLIKTRRLIMTHRERKRATFEEQFYYSEVRAGDPHMTVPSTYLTRSCPETRTQITIRRPSAAHRQLRVDPYTYRCAESGRVICWKSAEILRA
ncbi:uncharacterized protein [Diadema setosum]|uniref:uncharacterized protein n=1 Tax=Diadema setosum TaxID=31175 RepID=UPI003B3A6B50